MTAKLKVSIPGRPKGAGVQVAGLGILRNDEVYEVSDEAEADFRRAHGAVVTDAKGNSSFRLGPTIRQVAKRMYGFEVVKDDEPGDKVENDAPEEEDPQGDETEQNDEPEEGDNKEGDES